LGADTTSLVDTFPKLLLINAVRRGDRPAMREKEYGIWNTWTWLQVLEEIRPFSVGLAELGIRRDDKVAIIGANKPRLYWTMCAAQALGAIPVPVYQDSVADEMAYVLEHAGAKIAVVENQEQVDKLLSISDRLPTLSHIVYDEERGLSDYDHSRL
jgi:long-chain acyl-CoA synthetase